MIRGQVSADREAVVSLQLRAPDGRIVTVDAVVDTGFCDSLTLPSSLVASLQLPYFGTSDCELGDGSLVTFRVYTATVLWDGQELDTPIVASNGGALVGMRLLYGYHLFVDVIDGGEVAIQRRS
jgi:clan AA aspartic protease